MPGVDHECPIQVDDMQPGRPLLSPADGRLRRVVAVGRLRAGIALAQPDDLPPAQVDGRENDQSHAFTSPTKLRKIASPTCWLFSG